MSQIRIQRPSDTLPTHQSRNKTGRHSDLLNLSQYDRGRAQTRKSQSQPRTLRSINGQSTPGSKSTDIRKSLTKNQTTSFGRSASEHTKNIPMNNNNEQLLVRPQIKQWNSFHGDVPTSRSNSKNSITQSDNLFSIIKDEYNTKQLPQYHSIPNSTDNLFKALTNEEQPQPHEPEMIARSNSLYTKMSKLIIRASDSMTSLVSSKNDNQIESKSISESSESESEQEPEQIPDTQYTIESWKSPVDNNIPPIDLNEIIEEINEFHGNFVDTNTNNHHLKGKLNRTQQRILDYKQLYELDHQETPNGISSQHELKIQNETITSQYTSIRLRFSSHEIKSNKKQFITSYAGILGFINRFGHRYEQQEQEQKITIENKDLMLQKIWNDEYHNCFYINENDNQSENSTGIYNQDIDMSNLAKSVKLGY
ncbi:hypothetical protein JA1_001507 [Spathaspora sp. JA1]|nr:hypothetical protein JA1_001507 [Spathaspora sp. JA1]